MILYAAENATQVVLDAIQILGKINWKNVLLILTSWIKLRAAGVMPYTGFTSHSAKQGCVRPVNTQHAQILLQKVEPLSTSATYFAACNNLNCFKPGLAIRC